MATTLSSFSSLSLHPHLSFPAASLSFKPARPRRPSSLLLLPLLTRSSSDSVDTSFFDNVNPNEDIPFDPPAPPEGYVPDPSFDDLPPESEDAVAAAYEEIYAPAYSGVSVLGNDVYVMDSQLKKSSTIGGLGRKRREKATDGFEEGISSRRTSRGGSGSGSGWGGQGGGRRDREVGGQRQEEYHRGAHD